jgi:hypothetical protein
VFYSNHPLILLQMTIRIIGFLLLLHGSISAQEIRFGKLTPTDFDFPAGSENVLVLNEEGKIHYVYEADKSSSSKVNFGDNFHWQGYYEKHVRIAVKAKDTLKIRELLSFNDRKQDFQILKSACYVVSNAKITKKKLALNVTKQQKTLTLEIPLSDMPDMCIIEYAYLIKSSEIQEVLYWRFDSQLAKKYSTIHILIPQQLTGSIQKQLDGKYALTERNGRVEESFPYLRYHPDGHKQNSLETVSSLYTYTLNTIQPFAPDEPVNQVSVGIAAAEHIRVY